MESDHFSDAEMEILDKAELKESALLEKGRKFLECPTHGEKRFPFAFKRTGVNQATIVWYCHTCEEVGRETLLHELVVSLDSNS